MCNESNAYLICQGQDEERKITLFPVLADKLFTTPRYLPRSAAWNKLITTVKMFLKANLYDALAIANFGYKMLIISVNL